MKKVSKVLQKSDALLQCFLKMFLNSLIALRAIVYAFSHFMILILFIACLRILSNCVCPCYVFCILLLLYNYPHIIIGEGLSEINRKSIGLFIYRNFQNTDSCHLSSWCMALHFAVVKQLKLITCFQNTISHVNFGCTLKCAM